MKTNLASDIRLALRVFVKRPGFAATAVLTLALGIGGTAALFSVVYGVLLKPLPYPDPDRLVSIGHIAPHGVGTNHGPTTFQRYRDNQKAFEAIGAWDRTEVSITGAGDPERVEALAVSSATLPLLGVEAALGRVFTRDEDRPDQPLGVLLTHAYWQRRMGAAQDVIGKQLVVDGEPATVIGVLPASFTFPRLHPEILVPMPLNPQAWWISFGFQAIGRLKPGVTLAQANADVARMIALLPGIFKPLELRPNVTPLADDLVGRVRQILWILLSSVGLVWLIACGNVANLFLVRAGARGPELAMRAALGASRARIARVLLSESLVLALAGGVVGAVLAQGGARVLRVMAPKQLPRLEDIQVDMNVLLFTLVISLASGLLFGLLAVWRFGNPHLELRDGSRSVTDTPARRRTRSALVVGQVALAFTLLIVAGLMIRTFVAMRQVDPGFTEPQQVQTFMISIPEALIENDQAAGRTFEQLSATLASVPGVSSVGLASSVTMGGDTNSNGIEVESLPRANSATPPLRRFKSVAPGYFDTMGNHVVVGREISWREIHQQQKVAVISEALAREYWGDPARAIGQRIRSMQPNIPWYEIVGVVGDERDDGLNKPATKVVYWPMVTDNHRWRTMAFVVRSARVGTPGFVHELEQAVWRVNRNLPVANAHTLAYIAADSMAQTTFALVMLAIAAVVALAIGLVGIYGVVAYAAAQRTREIGIRMALGAHARQVRSLFIRHGVIVSATGVGIGIVLALVFTRAMTTLLFGIRPADPVTYAAVSVVLMAVALAATYLPAYRASSVDPADALRADA